MQKVLQSEDNSRKLVKTVAEMAELGRRPRLKILCSEWGVRVRLPFSVQKSYEFCRAYIGHICASSALCMR